MKIRTVADIMDRSELTLAPEMAIGAAMRTLLRARLNGAPVVDDDGRLCGMLTEKDCLKAVVHQAVDGTPGGVVRQYMTPDVQSVTSESQLLDVAQIFLSSVFRKVPVVDSGRRVVGQVSLRDILRAIGSAKDNSFLYGTKVRMSHEVEGVHSAMERALGKS